MVACDPAGCLQHYPMGMARFGLNPFGENLYRLVLASSRRFIVAGRWNETGIPRAQHCRLYPQVPEGEYVLEKWLSAFDLTGGLTREQWDLGPEAALGPYPHRGEYQMIGNTGFDPMQTNIEKLIQLVDAGSKYSWAQKLAACRNAAIQDELSRASLRESIIRDSLPAFGHAPFSQLSTGRGGSVKTSPVLRSANELGLPVPRGTPGEVTTGGGSVLPRKRRKAA